ncbi:hypothetical protein CFC21_033157 [Triticum aestivum]|uniref:Uncharacterized protein n=4 Tax=Triticinae TaxID=1648030 RepID=A0A453P4N1_AEGTS|nr:hypothetical protein CFC21_033157 [Triticum aestivum]
MLQESVSFCLSINTSTSLALIFCHMQAGAKDTEAAMDEGMELKGCVCRIKSCAGQLLSMEEDLVTDLDDDSWDLVWRDLRLKATFLYIDLSRVISRSENDERRKALTLLANKFFYCTDELGDAVTSRSVPVVKMCYNDTAQALRELLAALAPPQ